MTEICYIGKLSKSGGSYKLTVPTSIKSVMGINEKDFVKVTLEKVNLSENDQEKELKSVLVDDKENEKVMAELEEEMDRKAANEEFKEDMSEFRI